jgi:predicted O-linked N-acetylglucosamine transferase (SPINDLY family)
MTMLDAGPAIPEALAQGIAAHNAGQLKAARAIYEQILAEQPEQPTALHLLGLVDVQQGRVDEGCARIARVVELTPDAADAWAHLVTGQQLRGDGAAEAAALDRLLALQPDLADLWGRRGVLAFNAGELEGAVAAFTRAVELAPESCAAWTNLGAAQLRLGKLAEAEECQRRAWAADQTSADALNNLGNVLIARAKWAEAAPMLERVVRNVPGNANGWVNYGHALKGLRRWDEARAAYERGLALRPDDPAALLGIGDCLFQLKQPAASVPYYERSLAGMPFNADTHEHLGVALQAIGRLDESAAACRRALEIEPDRARVQSGLIFVLDLKEGAEAEARAEQKRWNELFGRPAERGTVVHRNVPDPERPLRVGYVSADFWNHSVAFAMLPILRSHDRRQVSIACYSGSVIVDQVSDEIRGLADLWRETDLMTDEELAAQIRADEIDILVDLSGHSGGNRLPAFARKPAPVQVTAWGYATGTGLDAIDYFLADPIVVPSETRASYAEQVIDLPSILCYTPPVCAPEVVPPPALARGYVTFGTFNRLAKISDAALATWARVLLAVPSSRLTIKCAGADVSPTRERLLAGLAARGVGPERVTILGSTPQPDHLASHGEVDIMLDTFPQNGGITTLDAVLLGVPVVTLLGTRVPGRASASFLTTLGLGDLVGTTTDKYVEIAARLAGDLNRLARERATLRDRLLASPLADAGQYTRAVEAVYREIWRRWCESRAASGESGAESGEPRVASGEGREGRRLAVAAPGRRGIVRAARAARRVEATR